MCRFSENLEASKSRNPRGLFRPVMGLLYLYIYMASVTGRWMSMEQLWSGIDGRKVSRTILFPPQIPHGLAWDSANNRLSHGTAKLLDMSVTWFIRKRCVFSKARTHCWPSAGLPCAQARRCCLWLNTRNYRRPRRGPRGWSSAIHPPHAIGVDPQVLPVPDAPSWWSWSGTLSMGNAGWRHVPLQRGQGQWRGYRETLKTEQREICSYLGGNNEYVALRVLVASSVAPYLPDCIAWC
jgi:hypothetical protein